MRVSNDERAQPLLPSSLICRRVCSPRYSSPSPPFIPITWTRLRFSPKRFQTFQSISLTLLSHFFAAIKLDPGFLPFYEWCRTQSIPVIVVSSGMEPIIRGILAELIGEQEAADIDIVANDVELGFVSLLKSRSSIKELMLILHLLICTERALTTGTSFTVTPNPDSDTFVFSP